MRLIFTILSFFILQNLFAQDSAMWNSGGHTLYQLQKSYDGVNWVTIGTIKSKLSDNSFTYQSANLSGGYFRVKADNVISDTILIATVTPVKIINVSLQNGVLSWTSENEDNLDYYSISESMDGIHFTEIKRVKAIGNQTYKVVL